MLSRVAENLYWMARYLERAEGTARLMRVTRHLMLDFPGTATVGWSSLVTIAGSGEDFDKHYNQRDERSVLEFFCADRRNPGSIASSLAAVREDLRTTREVMPNEVWEEINQLNLVVKEQLAGGTAMRKLDDFLRIVIRGSQSLVGLMEGSLSHSPARTFCDVGRYLERMDMTTRILDVRSQNLLPRSPEDLTPFENLQWMSVLKSLSAYQMYRQQMRHRVRGPDVVRFILQDRRFPRAVYRVLDDLRVAVSVLPRSAMLEGVIQQLQLRLDAVDASALAASPDDLHEFVDNLQIGFNEIHGAIKSTWFAGVDEPAPVIAHAH